MTNELLVIVKKSHTSFTIFYFIIAMNCGSWQYLSSHLSFRSHSVLLLTHELFVRNREWIESLCWTIFGLRSIKFHIFSVCSTRHEMPYHLMTNLKVLLRRSSTSILITAILFSWGKYTLEPYDAWQRWKLQNIECSHQKGFGDLLL